jgi:lactate dehydrogenase-like 2-hydroxyacid dehydrogenase
MLRTAWRTAGAGRLQLGGVAQDLAVAAGGVEFRRQERPAPYVDLAALRAEGRDYLNALSANTRYQLRRSVRHYAQWGPPRLERAADPAQAVDWLMVATPGGAATRHLVNAQVLQALGPKGWLVNISRGSVVDEAALIAALRDGLIAGAGLDVYADEPDIAPALLALPNTVFTPHMAGRSPQAQQAQMDLLLANLQACFEGRALPTAVN